jgi:3-hydroxyisobutyrate dehydrogenase
MAGHLQSNGHEVTVYNRSNDKAQKWHAKHGGQTAQTPKLAVQGSDFVISCVGNDDDLRSVFLGECGALAGMAKGAVYIDHTTVSTKVTSELYDFSKKQGIRFVDAPISGGQAGAENGVLSIMCGGDQDAYDSAEPVMSVYARICRRIGETGAGQKKQKCAIKLQ